MKIHRRIGKKEQECTNYKISNPCGEAVIYILPCIYVYMYNKCIYKDSER